MLDKADKITLMKLHKSHALIVHAAAAVHSVSLKEGRLVSLRETAVAGFEQLIDDNRLDVTMALKLLKKYDFSGPRDIYLAFKPSEMVLHAECHKRLGTLSIEPINRVEAVVIAIIRMGRPELGMSPLMDVRELEKKTL